MNDAACQYYPLNYFFPVYRRDIPQIKKVCERCDVRLKCLAWTLSWERDKDSGKRSGIFGGLAPREREALQKVLDKMMEEKENEPQV